MAAPAVHIDHSAYPHIFAAILAHADLETQNAVARTCKAYYDAFGVVDSKHIVIRTRGDTITRGTKIGGRNRRSFTTPSKRPKQYTADEKDNVYAFLAKAVAGAEVADVEYPAHNILTWGKFRSPGVARIPTIRVVATPRITPHRADVAWTMWYPSPFFTRDSLIIFSAINHPKQEGQRLEREPGCYYLLGLEYIENVFGQRHRLVINLDIPADMTCPEESKLVHEVPPQPAFGPHDHPSEVVIVFRPPATQPRQAPVRDPWWERIAIRLAKDIRKGWRYTFVGTDAFQPPMALGPSGDIAASFEEIVLGEHHKRHTTDDDPFTLETPESGTFEFLTRDAYRAKVGEEQFALETRV
ncbi:hypothetical protein Q8F55_008662 [Vanrija albida]|uniref:Uncharacterized protein n=1 Tax=Vanrija albida TaxID=181172 RepID=A0ABR3PRF8_9TREE